MSKEWLDLVQADGLHTMSVAQSIAELARFVDSVAVSLIELSHLQVYEVTGAEASAFLQGQFCNDLTNVSATQAQITGYCTPKGRLLALPTVLGFEDGYRLLVPQSVAEAFIKRLSMFIMRSDVTIRPLDDWACLGVTADSTNAPGQFSDVLGALPGGVLSVASSECGQLVRWHDSHLADNIQARYLHLAPVARQSEIWQSCEPQDRYSGRAWRLGDISAGVPAVSEGVVEAFVPQMVNMQLVNGLSFTKGCYPGQEIVARMQYLGKLKRHMRLFRASLGPGAIDTDGLLEPGAILSAGNDDNAGIVVDAMPVSDSSALVLAVTKVGIVGDQFSMAGNTLIALDMPYELPSLDVA